MDDIIDPGSATWRAVEKYAQKRLRTLRLVLENLGTPQVVTEATRARIEELKLLLSLIEPKPDIPAENTDNSAGY